MTGIVAGDLEIEPEWDVFPLCVGRRIRINGKVYTCIKETKTPAKNTEGQHSCYLLTEAEL